MKITLPTGGFADLNRTWIGLVDCKLYFMTTQQQQNVYLRVASLYWLDQEGFFDQEMGKLQPDPIVTELLKDI